MTTTLLFQSSEEFLLLMGKIWICAEKYAIFENPGGREHSNHHFNTPSSRVVKKIPSKPVEDNYYVMAVSTRISGAASGELLQDN